MWSVTIVGLNQIGALIQYCKYESVLTPTEEGSAFYRANVNGWRNVYKCIYIYIYIYIYVIVIDLR